MPRLRDRRAFLVAAGAAAVAGSSYILLGDRLEELMKRRRRSGGTAGTVPPVAAKHPAVVRRHGLEVVDDYAWLKTERWRDVLEDAGKLEPEIKAHLDAENAYARAVLSAHDALRRKLAREMTKRTDDEAPALPDRDGPWLYFTRLPEGAEYEQLCRRPAEGGPETVLLDGDREARGKSYWELSDTVHSPDHRLLAYAADTTGAERFTLRIRDLASGKRLPVAIRGTSGDFAWSSDSNTLFYVRLDAFDRPLEVWRHRIGTEPDADELVFRELDPAFDVSVDRTQSGAFVRIVSEGHRSSEVWLIDAAEPDSPPFRVAPREDGHQYTVEHRGDELVILTNSGGATDRRICAGPIAPDAVAAWRELVPGVAGRRITDMAVLERYCVRVETADGRRRVIARHWADGEEHALPVDGGLEAVEVSTGYEFDTDQIRIECSSPALPPRVYGYDLAQRRRTLLQATSAGPSYDPAGYVTRRLDAVSHDGTPIPVTVLYRKDLPLDGTAAVFLQGYAAYGDDLETDFVAERISLVDRGFVFALAHARGGSEKGAAWHAAGRHQKKLNSFKDYIAVAQHLADAGFAAPGRIVAYGESAGGMLVATAVNMAPHLFCGVIADAPFVDVLHTLLDPDLPLTPGEWPEFGNPIESRDDFELIRSYSPYDNVSRQPYPPMLVTTSSSDQRVGYWEAAKWVARLRELSTSGNPVLLVTEWEGGHDGPSGSSSVEVEARAYAFAISAAARGAA